MARGRKMKIRIYAVIVAFFANSAIGSAEIYDRLRSQNLLDTYLANLVFGVASNVVSRSNQLRPVQINAKHRDGFVNIYVLDAERLQGEPLAHLDISVRPVHRTFLAHRDSGSIFIDSGFLRELVTLNIMFWEQNAKMHQALAAYEVNGKHAYRNYWDPQLNPMVDSSDTSQYWLISFKGVLAFLIAHELGHIDLPASPQTDYSRPFRPQNDREFDIFWSCPELVFPDAKYWRAEEAAADQYALRILAHLGGQRYEHGAGWYLVYLLNLSMIRAVPLASPSLLPFLQQRYGNAFDRLRTASAATKGPIEAFYPKSHPDVLSRLAVAMANLYGDPPDPMLALWSKRLETECNQIQ